MNLVVQTAFLGDLLLSIPLLKKCREIWPDHELGLMCRKGFGDFFLKAGLVDHVYEIQKGQRNTYQDILKSLSSRDIDVLISPHESWRTRLFCFQVKAKTKVSYSDILSKWIFNQQVVKPRNAPDPIRQLSLLKPFSPELAKEIHYYETSAKPYTLDAHRKLESVPHWASMSLRKEVLTSTASYEALRTKLDLQDFDSKKAVLLFPGSVWATKRWKRESFIELGQKLQTSGHKVYIMGGPGEESLAEEVHQEIPGSQNWAGKTKVWESAQLIVRSALLVGNDSASTHLAAVCETPLIAVFGPTILEFGFRPWSNKAFIHHNPAVKCRPCGKHGHQKCPVGTHECMKTIAAEEVFETSNFILKDYSE